MNFDLDVRGRNCDRAVERSTALEEGDEFRALLLSHTLEVEPQADGIEESDIRADGPGAVHLAGDRDARPAERDASVLRQHLQKLDTAGGNTGKEDLAGRDRFSGAAVLDRPVHHEVVIPASAENASESVRGSSVHLVGPDIRLRHEHTSRSSSYRSFR
jgi:hypothetical protein